MFGTEIRTRHSRPSAGYVSSPAATAGRKVRTGDEIAEGMTERTTQRPTQRATQGKGHHMNTHAPAIEAARTSAAPASRLRLTRRGRVVFTTLAAIPLVLAALALSLNGGMATATDAAGAPLEYVTVSGGESLWVVAQEIAPLEDPREVIAQVLRFNELTSADVVAGQRLAVPTQYAG